jgi:membrane fusion protein, adhesin transport system
MSSLTNLIKGEEATLEQTEFSAKKSASTMLWIIAGFFVAFLLWATFTTLERTVHGMGRVVPSSKMQVVSNLEGGIIQEILVKPGQVVQKGDILVRLSPTLSTSEFGSNEASVDSLRAKIARLNAEVRGTTPNFTGVSASAASAENALHRARSAELSGMSAAGNARAQQAERAVAEAQSALAARRSNLDTAQQELEMLRPLAGRQIVSRIDLVKAENAVTIAQNEVAAAQSAVARSQAAVAEARASTSQARSDWSGRAGMELAAAQAELAARERSMPALADKVDRTTIRAPMTGRVNRVLVTTIGGSVSAGMPIAEIVPSDEALYIEAMVRPQDIANVRIGQRANVEITAYRSAVFGKLDGDVVTISPDAVINEKTGESFYTVEVRTVSRLKDADGKVLEIGPGMMANVSLLGEERSVLSYIFSPFTRLKENAFRE